MIAEREVTFARGDETLTVTIQFGAPVRSPKAKEDDPWWCPLKIDGLGPTGIEAMAGLDSLQAVILAMSFVREYLPEQAKSHDGEVYYLVQDMDVIFDQRRTVRLLSDISTEAVDVLEAAQPLLRSIPGNEAEEVVRMMSHVLTKYTRDLRLGDGADNRSLEDADRGLHERAKDVYLRLRDRFEPRDDK